VLIGEFIKNNYDAGSTIVYDQMGQTPWVAGMEYRFIDTWGLTDKKIGRYYLSSQAEHSRAFWLYDTVSQRVISAIYPETVFYKNKEEVLDYLFSFDPDVIMLTTLLLSDQQKIIFHLLLDERLKAHYVPRILIEDWVLVFEKKNRAGRDLSVPQGLQVKEGSAMMRTLGASEIFKDFVSQ
jgi:hypothetical protein